MSQSFYIQLLAEPALLSLFMSKLIHTGNKQHMLSGSCFLLQAFHGTQSVTMFNTVLQLGLRILRGAVWAAALTVSAVKTRHACYSTADAVITTISQLKGRYRPARRKAELTNAGNGLADSVAKGSPAAQLCAVGVSAGGAGLDEANSPHSPVVSEV